MVVNEQDDGSGGAGRVGCARRRSHHQTSSPRERHLRQEEAAGREPATPASQRRAFQKRGTRQGKDPEVGRAARSTRGRHGTGMRQKEKGLERAIDEAGTSARPLAGHPGTRALMLNATGCHWGL